MERGIELKLAKGKLTKLKTYTMMQQRVTLNWETYRGVGVGVAISQIKVTPFLILPL